MDSNREERRLQRQRGAQRHQVQDVDFGSPFPTAAIQQRITRSGASVQSELPSLPSNRKTPSYRGRSSSKFKTSQSRDISSPAAVATDANRSANTSAKRRKLNTVQDTLSSSPTRELRPGAASEDGAVDRVWEEPNLASAESQIAGRETPDKAVSEEEPSQIQPLTQTPKSQRLTSFTQNGIGEVAESPRSAPGSGRRQQVSFQEAEIPAVRLFENLEQQAPTARMTGYGLDTSIKLPNRRSPRNLQSFSAADIADGIDELSPDRTVTSHLNIQQQEFSDEEIGNMAEAEAMNDLDAARRLQRGRERKESEQGDKGQGEELSQTPFRRPPKAAKQKQSKARASPAVQRQPKKKPKAKSKSTSQKSHETISIVVHRLTKSIPYGEDDPDADILNEDIPFAKRSGVNAVDVLSQFCEEVVESGLEALEEGGSNAEDVATRKEYRTKLRAIEAFQEELRTRLLELTIVLDNNYLLSRRVKATQKEKIELRENLLRVRVEREKLALRMDEVRIKHENSSREAQEQQGLSVALHDIELAVSCGMENTSTEGVATEPAPPDLSALLKSIATTVSNNSHEGGILKQVKEFNMFLEKAALALESRS